jgi:arabinogalactan oligomer/maltooligosaccharide transport system permease protein
MGGLTGPEIVGSLESAIPILLIIAVGAVVVEVVTYILFHSLFKSRNALAYTLLAPAAVGLAIFVGWPIIFNVVVAFSNWRLANLLHPSFGAEYFVQNIKNVFTGPLLNTPDSGFFIMFGRTILWTVVNLVFHVSGGMLLALLLNRQLPLRGLYRTLLVIPWAIPQPIAALVWKGEFHQQFGFVNLMLARIGIQGPPWLSDGFWAFVAVCIVNIWLGIPFMMVVILGGLQSIAGEYLEAAEIDGASWWQTFRSVTLPLLQPVLGPAVALGTIWTFNNINVIFLVTGGGPSEQTNILVTGLYNAAFGFSKYGFGSAFSLVIFVILFAIVALWVRMSGALQGVYE